MENQETHGQTKTCPKCQEVIQASAKKCKHCQADLRNWFVRHKIITGILVIFVIGIIASAGEDKSEKVSTEETQQKGEAVESPQSESKEAEEEKTYAIGDSIQLGKAIITINQMETSKGGQFTKPQTGNEWVNLNITIENTDSKEQFVTTMGQMFLRDGEGNSYQVAVTDKSMESVNNNLDGAILAKSKRTGWVGFEVKQGVKGLQFQYNGSMWGGGNILVNLDK